MRIQIAAWIVIAATVFGVVSPAFAQKEEPAPRKLEFRKWDAGAGFGILGASGSEFGGSPADHIEISDPSWTWNVDVGRYFTPHLKADAGLMWATPRNYYGGYTSSQNGTQTYTFRQVHPTSVSGAFTYQFFENVFAHPYVSAGIRVNSLNEETEKTTSTLYIPNSAYQPPTPSTTSRKYAEVRPFVAAGYKSYFNERTYVRSEFLMAFDEKGVSHATVRLGFGFDF